MTCSRPQSLLSGPKYYIVIFYIISNMLCYDKIECHNKIVLYNSKYSILKLIKDFLQKFLCIKCFSQECCDPSIMYWWGQSGKIICHIPHNKGPLISLNIELKHQHLEKVFRKYLLNQNLNITLRVSTVDHMGPETIVSVLKSGLDGLGCALLTAWNIWNRDNSGKFHVCS